MRQSGENGLNIFIENKGLTLRWLSERLWETRDLVSVCLLGLDFCLLDSHLTSTRVLAHFLNYFEATQIQSE